MYGILEKLTYSMRPFKLIIVDKTYQGKVKLQKN